MEVPEVLTVDEAAEILKVARGTILRLIEHGMLPAYRVGVQIRIKTEELNTLLETPMPTGKRGNGKRGRPRVYGVTE